MKGHVSIALELGLFEMVSGRMAVSDPCYDRNAWCRGELEGVLNGTWRAQAVEQDSGKRIARLIAFHEDYAYAKLPRMERADFEVGVDSGQAGLFDARHYRDDSVAWEPATSPFGGRGAAWYELCCRTTSTPMHGGVIPYGAVSNSGYGDGCYGCTFWRNDDGKVVRVEIEFIRSEK